MWRRNQPPDFSINKYQTAFLIESFANIISVSFLILSSLFFFIWRRPLLTILNRIALSIDWFKSNLRQRRYQQHLHRGVKGFFSTLPSEIAHQNAFIHFSNNVNLFNQSVNFNWFYCPIALDCAIFQLIVNSMIACLLFPTSISFVSFFWSGLTTFSPIMQNWFATCGHPSLSFFVFLLHWP